MVEHGHRAVDIGTVVSDRGHIQGSIDVRAVEVHVEVRQVGGGLIGRGGGHHGHVRGGWMVETIIEGHVVVGSLARAPHIRIGLASHVC